MATSEPLVRVLRGGIEESVHVGALAVWEDSRLVLTRGDVARVVYYRSASKPLQALELVLSGAADAFGLSPAEVALAAGSHNGDPRHVAAARSILAKAGVPETALRCGGHRSTHADTAFAQRRNGIPVTSILSNCSGKHAGMLAAAKHRGDAIDGYLDPAHPVQAAIREHVAALAGIPAGAIHVGVESTRLRVTATISSLTMKQESKPMPNCPMKSASRSPARSLCRELNKSSAARNFDFSS
jgi:L-asparaginase II